MSTLVKLVVHGHVALGHQAQKLSPKENGGAVVELAGHANRQS